MRLQEKRTILSGKDAVALLQSGKLAGRLGGKKFIPKWVVEDPLIFESLVDATLPLFDSDSNTASDEVIQYLMKCCFEDPDKWRQIVQYCPDTLTELSKAFATDWFKKDTWQEELNSLITKKFNATDWSNLEHAIQDARSKRQAKKGKTISNTNNLYDTLYDDGTWKLYAPKCFEGDVELASHIKPFKSYDTTYNKTRWCTAAQESYYKRYTGDGNKLYVIQYWENGEYTEAWQLAFDGETHIEFMDKHDNTNYKEVRNAPTELLELVVCDNPRNKLIQGMSLKDLFDRIESNENISNAVDRIKYEVVKYDAEGYGLNRVGTVVSLPKDSVGSNVEVKCIHEWSNNIFEINGRPVDENTKLIGNDNIKRAKITGTLPEAFFKDCKNLEAVIFVDSRSSKGIYESAFENCTNLKKVEINDGMDFIDEFAFKNCTSLEKINLKSASPRDSSFEGCTNLKEVESYYAIPESINSIERIIIGYEKVGDSEFFQRPNLVEVEFLDSVKSIKKSAFENCENLVSIKFPKSSKVSVEPAAFLDCENLEFVENVENVEGNLKRIFAGCTKLKELQND